MPSEPVYGETDLAPLTFRQNRQFEGLVREFQVQSSRVSSLLFTAKFPGAEWGGKVNRQQPTHVYLLAEFLNKRCPDSLERAFNDCTYLFTFYRQESNLLTTNYKPICKPNEQTCYFLSNERSLARFRRRRLAKWSAQTQGSCQFPHSDISSLDNDTRERNWCQCAQPSSPRKNSDATQSHFI